MATSSRQWTKEETEEFIRRLEDYPELWDTSSEGHKDRSRRASAFTALAEDFDTDAIEIGRKLHNLRTQLNSELRKMKKRKSDKSSWHFFDSLKFMLQAGKIEEQTFSENSGMDDDCQENSEMDGDCQKNSGIDGDCQKNSAHLPSAPPRKKRNLEETEEVILDTALELLRVKDDDQIFGDFVVSVLRNLRTPYLKKSLKLKIQRAVVEIEERDLEYMRPPTPAS